MLSRLRSSPRPEINPEDVRMTLGEHLEELRSRIIKALVALAVGALICYLFVDHVTGFLAAPLYAALRHHGVPAVAVATNPAETFLTSLKVSFIVGFILSAPVSLWQIWGFIAAGLYPHERRWVRRFAPVSIVLFFAGAAFLLLVASPLLLSFLISYQNELPNYDRFAEWMLGRNPPLKQAPPEMIWPTTQPIPMMENDPDDPPEGMPWINLRTREMRVRIGDHAYTLSHLEPAGRVNRLDPMIRISEYVVFILHLAAAFGIGFQVPVAVAFIAAMNIASARQMAAMRSYIWFGMAILAAVITPPDITSMLLLLIPMAGLLEAGLLAARLIEKRRAAKAEASPTG